MDTCDECMTQANCQTNGYCTLNILLKKFEPVPDKEISGLKEVDISKVKLPKGTILEILKN